MYVYRDVFAKGATSKGDSNAKALEIATERPAVSFLRRTKAAVGTTPAWTSKLGSDRTESV